VVIQSTITCPLDRFGVKDEGLVVLGSVNVAILSP